LDGGNVPPVGMGVDQDELFLHNRDTSVATLRGPCRLRMGTPRIDSGLPAFGHPKLRRTPCTAVIPSSKQAQFAHCQNTRPAGLWTTRCIGTLLPQVGGARAAAFRGAGVPPRLVVLQLRGACARQLRPPIGGHLSTVRAGSAPALRPSAVPWRHLLASGSGCIPVFTLRIAGPLHVRHFRTQPPQHSHHHRARPGPAGGGYCLPYHIHGRTRQLLVLERQKLQVIRCLRCCQAWNRGKQN
jgi:hypothetical protein